MLRQAAVRTLSGGIRQYMIDNHGNLPYGIVSQPRFIGSGSDNVDLCAVLVPKYLSNIPIDPTYGYPNGGSNICTDPVISYNSGYQVSLTQESKILVKAVGAEVNSNIEAAR